MWFMAVVCSWTTLKWITLVHFVLQKPMRNLKEFPLSLIVLNVHEQVKTEKCGFIANKFHCYLYMNFISIYSKISEDAPMLQGESSLPPSFPPSLWMLFFPGKLNLKVIEYEKDYSQLEAKYWIINNGNPPPYMFFWHWFYCPYYPLRKRFEKIWSRGIRFCFGSSVIIIFLVFQFLKMRKCLQPHD